MGGPSTSAVDRANQDHNRTLDGGRDCIDGATRFPDAPSSTLEAGPNRAGEFRHSHKRGDALLSLCCVDPLSDPRWSTLVDSYGGSVFLSPAWLKVLVATYGFDLRAYVMTDERGRPRAGIPFCRVDDVRGRRIVVLPFSDFCDPILTETEQWRVILDALLAEQIPLTVRSLRRDVAAGDDRLMEHRRARWHGLDLEPDLESIWAAFPSQVRQRIRRAQRDGVVVRVAETEAELRTFFEMHTRVRKYKYRLLPQPYEFFVNIWREFHSLPSPSNIMLLLARCQERIIAGTLFLRWKDTLYYKFNASDPEFLRHRPNDLLIWEAIAAATSMNLKRFDFGLSDWDQDGLVRFKSQYATEEGQITTFRSIPKTNPSGKEREIGELLSTMTALLTDASVSDEVTERGGARLYRFFV